MIGAFVDPLNFKETLAAPIARLSEGFYLPGLSPVEYQQDARDLAVGFGYSLGFAALCRDLEA